MSIYLGRFLTRLGFRLGRLGRVLGRLGRVLARLGSHAGRMFQAACTASVSALGFTRCAEDATHLKNILQPAYSKLTFKEKRLMKKDIAVAAPPATGDICFDNAFRRVHQWLSLEGGFSRFHGSRHPFLRTTCLDIEFSHMLRMRCNWFTKRVRQFYEEGAGGTHCHDQGMQACCGTMNKAVDPRKALHLQGS